MYYTTFTRFCYHCAYFALQCFSTVGKVVEEHPVPSPHSCPVKFIVVDQHYMDGVTRGEFADLNKK